MEKFICEFCKKKIEGEGVAIVVGGKLYLFHAKTCERDWKKNEWVKRVLGG